MKTRFNDYLKEDLSNNKFDIITDFCEKYPEHSEFFKSFIVAFPRKKVYDDTELSYCEEEYENDEDPKELKVARGLTDEEIIDTYWHPELEVYLLEQELGQEFPGEEIWVDFINALNESDWKNL